MTLQAFGPLVLSASFRPVLLNEEFEIATQIGVALYDGEDRTPYENGVLVLTTQRICWIQSEGGGPGGKPLAMAAVLSQVQRLQRKSGFTGVSSPKISVYWTNPPNKYVKLSFRKGGLDDFLKKFEDVLARKPWLQVAVAQAKQEAPRAFTTTSVGVAGIMRDMQAQERRTQTALSEAFSDMNSLMEHARTLVGVAQKMKSVQNKLSGAERDEYEEWMMNLGLVSPVSRDNIGSGNNFHKELSKQLCDFLQEPLQRHNGTISLVDVFCLYNRARGTDLVSPDDIVKACELWAELKLPLLYRRFESGVKVVQLPGLSPEEVRKTIQQLLPSTPVLDPWSLSTKMNISLNLATEYLWDAERYKIVCRDESIEGVVFFANIFDESKPENIELVYNALRAGQ